MSANIYVMFIHVRSGEFKNTGCNKIVMFLDQFQGRYGDSWISFRVAAVTPGCSRELATGAWK